MEAIGKNYSIAAVSKLTGVSCHALRIWERRYGFPVPSRSPSGHRRYSPEHVRALTHIAGLAKEGRPVGDLIGDHLAGKLSQPMVPAGGPGEAPPSVATLVDRLLRGDPSGAAADFDELAASMDEAALVGGVLEPAMVEVGERWFRGTCDVYQEHCATGFLTRKLEGLVERAQRANAAPKHLVLLGTVQGDRHGGGVLMLALLLELAGWRTVSLGVDLPVREYLKAIQRWRPDALALSFVMSRNINKRFKELEMVREVPVFVGGRSILNYQGLARRHGLIPVPGSASQGMALFLARFQEWRSAHPESPVRR